MEFLKKAFLGLGIAVATLLLGYGVALEIDHHRQSRLMWGFFAEILVVVDNPSEPGKQIPLTRADILKIITSEALKKESR